MFLNTNKNIKLYGMILLCARPTRPSKNPLCMALQIRVTLLKRANLKFNIMEIFSVSKS